MHFCFHHFIGFSAGSELWLEISHRSMTTNDALDNPNFQRAEGFEFRRLTWLASYPKSGNTWVRAFLAAYVADAREPIQLTQLNRISRSESKIELFAALAGSTREPLTTFDIDSLRYSVQQKLARTIPPDCVVKTHNAYTNTNGFPLICREFTRGAIYIVRNPLDIVDSLADHANLSIDTAIRLMNDRHHRLGGPESKLVLQYVDSWSRHVQSWISQRDFPVLIIRYEDLKVCPAIVFEKLVRHLGWEVDDARLKRAIELSDFKLLQRAESVSGFAEKSQVATSGRFFRRGECGGWSKTLNPNQIASIVADHGPTMQTCGYLSAND